jgi:hypothetical protein
MYIINIRHIMKNLFVFCLNKTLSGPASRIWIFFFVFDSLILDVGYRLFKITLRIREKKKKKIKSQKER